MYTLTATSRVWNSAMPPTKGTPQSALRHISLHLISTDLDINSWNSSGIQHLSNLFSDTHLKSFQDICQTYLLSDTDFYKYLRVCHILSTVKWTNNAIAGDLLQLLDNQLPKTFRLSVFYALLQKPRTQSKTPTMEFWEREFKFNISVSR